MQISILTLFPDMFQGPFSHSIVKRAQEKQCINIIIQNMRDVATDKHKSVDDHPYGGGTGMVLRVDIVDLALKRAITHDRESTKRCIILLDPQGIPYTQTHAQQLTTFDHIVFICGHYEGVDERVRALVDCEYSIGDYVLSGGEIPAMVLTDSIVRLLPGVLKADDATTRESFGIFTKDGKNQDLEYPQYTKPLAFNGEKVPDILLSGNHAAIEQWRLDQARIKTIQRRPDLLKKQTDLV